MANKHFVNYDNTFVPQIKGAKGGGKGGGGGGEPHTPVEHPQSLFSTDILFVVVGLGEGPVYRINPNGPQDIELGDNSIDDLVNLDGNGLENEQKFKTLSTTGTTVQNRLDVFGETTTTPQNFASPVSLKSGSSGIPASGVTLQETSSKDWDALDFMFQIGSLQKITDKGDILNHSLSVAIDVFDHTGSNIIATGSRGVTGKTTVAYKFTIKVQIPEASKNTNGYRFSVRKTSSDSTSSGVTDDVKLLAWNEIENSPQAYPRTAHIGFALKATDEHNGIPTFTSLVKGLVHKVPSNYNQPTLASGEIDWRMIECPTTGANSPATAGYYMQQTGSVVQTSATINIYRGTWDGTFVYSWSQNPVWIIFDILTNKTYGLGIPDTTIDKYRFYQIAQFCDACDYATGNFVGVDGIADGTFRSKPRNTFTSSRENQLGISQGTKIRERRFTLNTVIADQKAAFDTLNALASSFRGAIIYAHGKITLACDLPDETPVMVFNETNIEDGSFIISGNKESEVLTGVDVSYIDPGNHYKRETVRIDQLGSNDGISKTEIENIESLDIPGITRRGQALRYAQYQIASSRYLRRTTTFNTSTDALQLVPGDVIAVSQQSSGVAYGYGGKIRADSPVQSSNTNVFIEHFTVPSLGAVNFNANTGPLVLRVVKLASDRIDTYIVSNTKYALSTTDAVTTGVDQGILNPIKRYNSITRVWDTYTAFTSNTAPSKGDLWTFGEIEAEGDIYRAKSDKLFKVTNLDRELQENKIKISATEYISNVYVDSDKFIDYRPTAYTDIQSSLSVPPVPNFSFAKSARRTLDGSVVVDGVLKTSTDQDGFGLTYITEYEMSKPLGESLVANANLSGISGQVVHIEQANVFVGDINPVTLAGKSGFSSPIGEVKLLCTAVNVVDTSGGTSDGNIEFTLEGFGQVFDENFQCSILDANDAAVFGALKGTDHITIPINEKSQQQGLLNFVGFAGTITDLSQPITGFTLATDKIKIENKRTEDVTLVNKIPSAPFYVTLNQLVDSRHYSNNSFYVRGSEHTYIKSGEINGNDTTTIELPVSPRDAAFVRLFVDGTERTSGQFVLNKNDTVALNNANIVYTSEATETSFRAEVDYYNVPIFEIGDNVQVSHANVFSIATTSFDPLSPKYNAALTANYIYRVHTSTTPVSNIGGLNFTNVSLDPVGKIGNAANGSGTFEYDTAVYPGRFTLANNRIYHLETGSDFEAIFLTKDKIIPNLLQGTTSIRARNKSRGGRLSAFNTKSINVQPIPIQKVVNASIVESLYREQTGGVAVRVTVQFDHIEGQEVTDYEISYKLDSVDDVGVDDGGTDLTSFNTVKVPATGVDSDGKIRFTVNGINRGQNSDSRNVIFRIVPLNKDLRGIIATLTKSIIGKTAKPENIFNFTGGQQTDQITLLWSYPRTADGELKDIDLKEVVIKRIPGTQSADIENFVVADNLVTVSAGTARKSIPIDTFGEFTYLARSRDTSGNFSDGVVAITLTTSRPVRSTVIRAYNEDEPTTAFAGITNDNSGETNFPSFTSSNTGGLAFAVPPNPTPPGESNVVDNANGTATGFSASTSVSDLLATESAEYITSIRDVGATITGAVFVDIEGSQSAETTFNDSKETYLSGVTDASGTAGVLKDASFGGIGHVLGHSNTAVVNPRFDVPNQTFMTGGASGNVFAIWDDGKYTGNVTSISAITKASPAVITTDANHKILPPASITAITKANPAVVTAANHGFINGDVVKFASIGGMTELNGTTKTVANKSDNTFELSGTDSSGFTTYTSGGTATTATRLIIHDVLGMTEINNREVFAKYASDTTVEIFTDATQSTALDSSGFTTYSSGGVVDEGDYANANSYALIAGVIDADEIRLGASYFSNGDVTGGNVLANITTAASSYKLVNFKQYIDTGSGDTFAGALGAVSSQTLIRTTTAANAQLYYANGNVNINEFIGSAVNDGFQTYQAGSRTFRQFQLKFIVKNNQPDEFDFTIDKFRYTIEKDTVTFTDTTAYNATTKTVDITEAGFLARPVISYSMVDEDSNRPHIVVTTAASNQAISYQVFKSDDGSAGSTTSGMSVMMTAIGV
jgi:hypothetical protein